MCFQISISLWSVCVLNLKTDAAERVSTNPHVVNADPSFLQFMGKLSVIHFISAGVVSL